MHRGRTTWVIAAAAAIALTGCSASAQPPGPTPSSSSSVDRSPSTAVPLELSDLETAPEGTEIDEESGGGTVAPIPAPPWDAQQRSIAIGAAETAVRAFARPDLGAQEWGAGLAPLLTPQAQQDYQYVDPANVPAHTVTGAGTITDETSSYAVSVTVPTDAGTYTVLLARLSGDAPWLVSRFTPPEGTH